MQKNKQFKLLNMFAKKYSSLQLVLSKNQQFHSSFKTYSYQSICCVSVFVCVYHKQINEDV